MRDIKERLKEAIVGDEIYSKAKGWQEILSIEYSRTYPIRVKTKASSPSSYTLEGKWHVDSTVESDLDISDIKKGKKHEVLKEFMPLRDIEKRLKEAAVKDEVYSKAKGWQKIYLIDHSCTYPIRTVNAKDASNYYMTNGKSQITSTSDNEYDISDIRKWKKYEVSGEFMPFGDIRVGDKVWSQYNDDYATVEEVSSSYFKITLDGNEGLVSFDFFGESDSVPSSRCYWTAPTNIRPLITKDEFLEKAMKIAFIALSKDIRFTINFEDTDPSMWNIKTGAISFHSKTAREDLEEAKRIIEEA